MYTLSKIIAGACIGAVGLSILFMPEERYKKNSEKALVKLPYKAAKALGVIVVILSVISIFGQIYLEIKY